MADLKCPFSLPLVTGEHACPRGREVTRRGGTEIQCQAPDAWADCQWLSDCLKGIVLARRGLADDLLEVPHGVWARIQHAGPAAVARLTHPAAGDRGVTDLGAVAGAARRRFGQCEALAQTDIGTDIERYPMRRRGRREQLP